ncbi:MAG: hypothetical protein JNM89_08260 [Hyphomicrobiaceae bacterium]|nr:hypothetical protein [Hyphomicrobiaceae bacterium]
MIRRLVLAAALAAVTAGPSLAQDADVAGRPALVTKSTQDLIKQREVWGSKPSMTSAQAAAMPTGPTVAGRPALSTKSTAELLKERDQWGKGPESKIGKLRQRIKEAGKTAKRKAKAAYRAGKKKVKKAIDKVKGKKS